MKNQKKNRRRILLCLPVVLLPFLALIFYAMGGGKAKGDDRKQPLEIDASLPDASFKRQDPKTKLGVYALTQRDSVNGKGVAFQAPPALFGESANESTRAIDAKLQALEKQLSAGEQAPARKSRDIRVPDMGGEVDRLEKLMANMQNGEGADKELSQLSGMLEKVLDIQHPDRVRNTFIKEVTDRPDSLFAAIPAAVKGKQTLVQGATLRLELSDSIRISGIFIPKGHELFGICNLTNQRLLLDIKTIRLGNRIIPVDLSVYGLDGIRGIAAPDAVVGNAVSGGADDAVRSLQLMTMDASMGTQIAGAGIDAAKGLFSKKVKRMRVRLCDGYQVLLRNNQDRR